MIPGWRVLLGWHLVGRATPFLIKIGRHVRGEKRTYKRTRERMGVVARWPSWYRLSTNHEQRKYRSTDRIHGNEWYSGFRAFTLTVPEFTYRVAIILLSATITGIGLGQIIWKLIGG